MTAKIPDSIKFRREMKFNGNQLENHSAVLPIQNAQGGMLFMTDPYDFAANKVAAKLEILSKELCTNETINTWCEIVSKTVSEQRDGGQSPEKE